MGRKCEKKYSNSNGGVKIHRFGLRKNRKLRAYFFFGAAFFALGEAVGFLALGAAAFFFGAAFFGEAAGFFAGAAFLAAGLAPVFYNSIRES